MSDDIPFGIQIEIIKKVCDIKSLIQFRSVSKPWKSFIDSSEFINGYGARHTQPHSRILGYRSHSLSDLNSHICLVDDNMEILQMGGNTGDHGDAMEWSEEREKYLLEILLERVKRDPNGSPVFKVSDWADMSEQIFLKFAVRYGPEKVKGKYHRLKATYTKFSELITRTGVTWDATSGVVYADDGVWSEYFMRDKIFKTFKKKGCQLYPLLTLVFSASGASGTFHNASTSVPQNSDEEHKLEAEYLGVKAGEVGEVASGSKKRKSEGEMEAQLGMRRKKKISGNEKFDALVDVWSESMAARKEIYLAKADKYKGQSSEATLDEFSIDSCMSALNATPGVSKTCYIKALDRFVDANWRKIFLLMTEERRSDWLESLNE